MVTLALALLTSLAVAGGWWLLRGQSSGLASPPPAVTIDVSLLGQSPQVLPLAPQTPVVAVDDLRIVQVLVGTTPAVAALNVAKGEMAWAAPLPQAPKEGCSVHDDLLDCPGAATVQVRTGGLVSAGRRKASGTAASAGSSSSPSPSPVPAPASKGSLRPPARPDPQAPIAVDSSGRVLAAGKDVTDLRLKAGHTAWAAAVTVPKRVAGVRTTASTSLWVVSDGTTLAGVDGSTLVWQTPLPAGTEKLTRLDGDQPPRWLISPDAVVVAGDEGIVAFDPGTGKQLWHHPVQVTSWVAHAGTVLVAHGPTVTVLTQGARGAAQPTTPPSSTGQATTSSTPGQTPQPVTVPPGTIDLRRATLPLPPKCAELAGTDKGTFAPLPNHPREMSQARSPDGRGQVFLGQHYRALANGQPAVVVNLGCTSGGKYTLPVMALYDGQHQLLGAVELDTIPQVSRAQKRLYFEQVSVVGGTAQFQVEHLGLPGDHHCELCEGSGQAQVTASWDGKTFAIRDVLFTTPEGQLRVPELADVQAAYDAVASGNDEVAGRFLSGHVRDRLAGPVPGGGTYHDTLFRKGGKIAGCWLAGTSSSDGTFSLPGGGELRYAVLQPGDVVCPYESSALPTAPAERGGTVYNGWLILEAQADGDFQVKDVGSRG